MRDIWRGRTWSDVTDELSYRLKRDAATIDPNNSVKRRKKNEVGEEVIACITLDG